MTENSTARKPGFWRICTVDAYLFKLCCIFIPVLLMLLVYDLAVERPPEDFMLPALFASILLGAVYFRWSAISGIFKNHEAIACLVADISPASGMFGVQVFVSFFVPCDGGDAERGCFLLRFNPRVKKLRKGDQITVLWNYNNLYAIKEAYLDDV